MLVSMQEVVSVRDQCTYFIVEDAPEFGRFWAVQLVPVEPPGELSQFAVDGGAPERVAVVVADLAEDGKWRWGTLTPSAKHVFLSALLRQNVEHDRWYYIVEVDQKVLEMTMASELEDEDEVSDEG